MSKSDAASPADNHPLAYQNEAFLNSSDGRIVRIISEYSEPLARFRRERIQDTVVFFGSARVLAMDAATQALEKLGPADANAGQGSAELRSRAEAAVEMARYYEDARQLAGMLTAWARTLKSRRQRFVVTSGGGPGIMEAANRGAAEAGGKTVGLNIRLPFEQSPNPYITHGLNFEFHYFFMRKYWFAYLAKALVVFPGGFGTMDELFELLTLCQTKKLAKHISIVIYGSKYWNELVSLDALVRNGMISPEDRDLFYLADTPQQAFDFLKDELTRYHLEPEGARAKPPTIEEEQLLNPEIAQTR
jgi:hypothetical protein